MKLIKLTLKNYYTQRVIKIQKTFQLFLMFYISDKIVLL